MPLNPDHLRQLSKEGDERSKREAAEKECERRQKLEDEIRILPPLCERYLEEVAKSGRREATVAHFITTHYGSSDDPYYEHIEHALTVRTSLNNTARKVVCATKEEGVEMLRRFYNHFRRFPGLSVKYRKGYDSHSIYVRW